MAFGRASAWGRDHPNLNLAGATVSERNKHGLSRDIPHPVKREVRQRCGFGCVICGSALYQYHHDDPPFEDATEHQAEGIVLLCDGCHGLKTRGRLSDDRIRAAAAHPKSLEKGFSFGAFDVGDQPPTVVVCGSTLVEPRDVLTVGGETLLAVAPPESPGGPFRLSAKMLGIGGELLLQIEENEWKTPTGNWDVELTGRHITIRRGPGEIALRIRTDPPHTLAIESMDMVYRDVRVRGDEKELRFDSAFMRDVVIENARIERGRGIRFDPNRLTF
jgi:hypothetical protein